MTSRYYSSARYIKEAMTQLLRDERSKRGRGRRIRIGCGRAAVRVDKEREGRNLEQITVESPTTGTGVVVELLQLGHADVGRAKSLYRIIPLDGGPLTRSSSGNSAPASTITKRGSFNTQDVHGLGITRGEGTNPVVSGSAAAVTASASRNPPSMLGSR
jgi:hypothetical protein